EERPDHELAGLDDADVTPDGFDHTDILVTHRGGALAGLDASVRPQVRAADARRRQADDGVGRFDDAGVVATFQTDVTGSVEDGASHSRLLPGGVPTSYPSAGDSGGEAVAAVDCLRVGGVEGVLDHLPHGRVGGLAEMSDGVERTHVLDVPVDDAGFVDEGGADGGHHLVTA